jgi:NAD(P)-dependent dehydrogenase (short-subunit alcohol dehydrogenase family)
MLQDKIAVAGGGGTGVGKAIGLQLAKNRAKVAMASRIASTSLPLNLKAKTNGPADLNGGAKKGRHPARS